MKWKGMQASFKIKNERQEAKIGEHTKQMYGHDNVNKKADKC